MPRCARCAARCSKPTSRSTWRAPSSTGCARRAVGADVDQVGHARPDGREDRPRRAGRRRSARTREPIDLNAPAPVAIMMVGLQGSGKTTTTAKVAKRLTELNKSKVLMASLDTRRPAAMEQLAVLGKQVGVDTLPIVAGQTPPQIARRAIEAAKLGGYDVVLLDTAGRITLDEAMMAEAAEVKRAADPHEVIAGRRCADRPGRGQSRALLRRARRPDRHRDDARRRRRPRRRGAFHARGHRQADQADRHRRKDGCAGRSSIPRASPAASSAWATSSRWSRRPPPISTPRRPARTAERMRKGAFDLTDLREQLAQMQKMGGMCGLMGMMPGMAKMKNQLAAANLDDSMLKRQCAIINSMTPQERRNPDILKASRKKRIAAGSGTSPEQINKLLKMHRGMADMMKAMGGAKRGPMAQLANAMGIGGGMPSPKRCRRWRRRCRQQGGGACRPACRACRRISRNAGAARTWRRNCRAGRISRPWEEEMKAAQPSPSFRTRRSRDPKSSDSMSASEFRFARSAASGMTKT